MDEYWNHCTSIRHGVGNLVITREGEPLNNITSSFSFSKNLFFPSVATIANCNRYYIYKYMVTRELIILSICLLKKLMIYGNLQFFIIDTFLV